jgi:hypothetical protein
MINRKISIVIFGVLFLIVIYNTKRSDYVNDLNFYKKDIQVEILDIIQTRGIKVYYTKDDFFYLDIYKGVPLEKGDVLKKVGSIVTVYRENKNHSVEIAGTGEIIKPKDSYFEYFFE